MSNPHALQHLPTGAVAAFREEHDRIAAIRALIDAISKTEAQMEAGFRINAARVAMVGQILQVQRQQLAHGEVNEWFVRHFGEEKLSTMKRWVAVGDATAQRAPELAGRVVALLGNGDAQPDEAQLEELGREVIEASGASSLTALYKWAARVRNPEKPKRVRPPQVPTPEQKRKRELAELAQHLGEVKQALHVLSTPKMKAMIHELAEENPAQFAALRHDLEAQWAGFVANLKAVKLKGRN